MVGINLMIEAFGQPEGTVRAFIAGATAQTVLTDTLTGVAMVVGATEELVILGGEMSVSGSTTAAARLDDTAGNAIGPTLSSTGAGATKNIAIMPQVVAKGEELRLDQFAGATPRAEVSLCGYIRPSKS